MISAVQFGLFSRQSLASTGQLCASLLAQQQNMSRAKKGSRCPNCVLPCINNCFTFSAFICLCHFFLFFKSSSIPFLFLDNTTSQALYFKVELCTFVPYAFYMGLQFSLPLACMHVLCLLQFLKPCCSTCLPTLHRCSCYR